MYSVWKNGKCLKMYKSLKKAFSFYCAVTEKSDELKDCVELLNPNHDTLYCF